MTRTSTIIFIMSMIGCGSSYKDGTPPHLVRLGAQLPACPSNAEMTWKNTHYMDDAVPATYDYHVTEVWCLDKNSIARVHNTYDRFTGEVISEEMTIAGHEYATYYRDGGNTVADELSTKLGWCGGNVKKWVTGFGRPRTDTYMVPCGK